jgi:hypothetical protein
MYHKVCKGSLLCVQNNNSLYDIIDRLIYASRPIEGILET